MRKGDVVACGLGAAATYLLAQELKLGICLQTLAVPFASQMSVSGTFRTCCSAAGMSALGGKAGTSSKLSVGPVQIGAVVYSRVSITRAIAP